MLVINWRMIWKRGQMLQQLKNTCIAHEDLGARLLHLRLHYIFRVHVFIALAICGRPWIYLNVNPHSPRFTQDADKLQICWHLTLVASDPILWSVKVVIMHIYLLCLRCTSSRSLSEGRGWWESPRTTNIRVFLSKLDQSQHQILVHLDDLARNNNTALDIAQELRQLHAPWKQQGELAENLSFTRRILARGWLHGFKGVTGKTLIRFYSCSVHDLHGRVL